MYYGREEGMIMDHESLERDYSDMPLRDLVETVIRDSIVQGTVTYPLRKEGYHSCSNLIYTDRLK